MLKILWFDFKKGIFFFIAAVVIVFAPKFIYYPYINNDINEVLILCEGESADEAEQIADEYIDKRFGEVIGSGLSDEEKAAMLDRITVMSQAMYVGTDDKRAVEELIENAKTDCGISLDTPPQYYYDNIEEYKSISRPVNIVDQSSWRTFMHLQQIQLASVMALCVIAAVWGKHSEHGLFRSERVSPKGKRLNSLRTAFALGFCGIVWLVSYIVDIVCCGVGLLPDTAIQSINLLRYSPLAISIGEYLALVGILELIGLIFSFMLFYLINSCLKDIRKAITSSAFIILLSYVLKNGFSGVFSPITIGICDYVRLTDGSLYNTFGLIMIIAGNVIAAALLAWAGRKTAFLAEGRK